MINLFYRFVGWLTGKNLVSTPKSLVLDQMSEMRPLPLGATEFEEWSDRIISGAMLPADVQSQKFALAEMIMHIKSTEDHCNDGFFIKSLRKSAANQVAHAKMAEIRNAAKSRLAAKEAEPLSIVGGIAANKKD